VSQIVAAAGELDDFQRNTAMEKARDHVDAALKRAGENPPAPRSTVEALRSERDPINKANFLQQVLFSELDDVRRDRQTLSDLQARLSSMTNDIDNALGDALGATFDYFRAGGQ
ncbi:MAG TPA: hypothetical protein VII32_18775, partial [Thermoanaerobaculia bacterium]